MEIREVFISYSRKDLDTVKGIKSVIEHDCGVKCWMDLKAIESGSKRFTKDIICGINNCKVFLFMLSENSQCSEFALRELSFADDKGKHVVIVNVNDCSMSDEFKFLYGLTDTISWRDVPQREKLLSDLKRWAGTEDIVVQELDKPTEEHKKQETFLKLKSDLDCVFYLDGEKTSELKAGVLSKIPLREGEYELKFVSLENAEDVLVEDFQMLPYDKRYDVKLIPVREKRLELEVRTEEIRQKAEQEQEERERIEAERKAKEFAEREKKERECQEEIERKQDCRTVSDGLIFNANGVEFKMIMVEGGSFWMGADDGKRIVKTGLSGEKEETYAVAHNFDEEAGIDEKPVHSVTLSGYYMGETVVTQALWKAVMGNNPSFFKGDFLPVHVVNWDDCQAFIRKLNQLTGKNFRLPTEAEWEYAARGGKNSNGFKYAGSSSLDSVAWFGDNSGEQPHVVKGKSPNELGLYDMSGNVWEWCQDWHDFYSDDPQTNPDGLAGGSFRVIRGGSWYSSAKDCRVSCRSFDSPNFKFDENGFRLCLPQ